MNKEKEIDWLVTEINNDLRQLESSFFEEFVAHSMFHGPPDDDAESIYDEIRRDDTNTWLIHGTRMLYYKILLFLELKGVPMYYKLFIDQFNSIVKDNKAILKSRAGLYNHSEPSMVVHDDFREFLSAFVEFDTDQAKRLKTNRFKNILDNTNLILSLCKTTVTNEASIYNVVREFIEIVYPSTRPLNKARFIKKDWTYHPDILTPEISSAVEYKYIKSGKSYGKYLDEIKTDADNYEGDPEYKFFYAIVYYQDKSAINKSAFEAAVEEKKFPRNWIVFAL